MNTKDIPEQTEQETDAFAERVFSEWSKWFDNPIDLRKESLKTMQNELRVLYDAYVEKKKARAEKIALAELLEQITVLDKKMRQTKKKLMEELWK